MPPPKTAACALTVMAMDLPIAVTVVLNSLELARVDVSGARGKIAGVAAAGVFSATITFAGPPSISLCRTAWTLNLPARRGRIHNRR